MQNLDIIVQLLAYEGNPSNDPSDTIKITNRIQDNDIQEYSRVNLSIADGTTDQTINLPDPTVDYLLIFCDQACTIKLNGGSEIITLTPRASGTKSFVFYQKGSISGLLLSNSSGNIAQVDIISVKS